MFLNNAGILNVGEGNEKIVISVLEKNNVKPVDVGCKAGEIEIVELYGDIEFALGKSLETLKELGVTVSGNISYWGDYEGIYQISDNKLREYSSEEWSVIEALECQEIISSPFAEKLCAKIREIQLVSGLPVTANLALEELISMVNGKLVEQQK